MGLEYHAVARRLGSAAAHHRASFAEVSEVPITTAFGPMVAWELLIESDALVLGGRQTLTESGRQRAQRAGVEVVTRSSGGGAVYLSARTSLWVDLWFPTPADGKPVDLSTLFVGVGTAWAQGIAQLGLDAKVHRGPGTRDPDRKRLAQQICFADVGWGEVVVRGAKVVGLSQRRMREGVRMQCVAELSGSGRRVLDFIETTQPDRDVVEVLTAPVGERSAQAAAAVLLNAVLSL